MMQMPTGADQGQPRALCAPQKCDAEWCKQHRLQVTPEQKQHAKENVRRRSEYFFTSRQVCKCTLDFFSFRYYFGMIFVFVFCLFCFCFIML